MNKYLHGSYQQETVEQDMTLLADEERKIKNKAMELFLKAVLCDSLSALAELVELVKEHSGRFE